MARRIRWLTGISTLLALTALLTLALPVAEWRTGEVPQPPLDYAAAPAATPPPDRLWVDTDPACGTGSRRDPDDCLALLALLQGPGPVPLAVATVFGNAPLAQTDAVARRLLEQGPDRSLPVVRGCAAPVAQCSADPAGAAEQALAQALQQGPLTYLALGPLTNLATLLRRQPQRAARITRIVAVMGKRPGHLFHPSENRGRGAMLLGHGPIFRDLNAVLDPEAVAVVLAAGIPLTLVPYGAARGVLLTSAEVDALAGTSAAGAWVAARSRDWLQFWRTQVGLDGFYPFDLLAVAWLLQPQGFRCARVQAWVGPDRAVRWFDRAPALLVAQHKPPATARATGRADYCDIARADLRTLLLRPADPHPPPP